LGRLLKRIQKNICIRNWQGENIVLQPRDCIHCCLKNIFLFYTFVLYKTAKWFFLSSVSSLLCKKETVYRFWANSSANNIYMLEKVWSDLWANSSHITIRKKFLNNINYLLPNYFICWQQLNRSTIWGSYCVFCVVFGKMFSSLWFCSYISIKHCWWIPHVGMVCLTVMNPSLLNRYLLFTVMQIKQEISTMKLIRHPNVIRMHEVRRQ